MSRNKKQRLEFIAKDNNTLTDKIHLRKKMLAQLGEPPVILETHGGTGQLFSRCYPHTRHGIVFETDPKKTETLVRQRPNWTVCETDCVWALGQGVGNHLRINFIDADPYGQAWQVLQAFFGSEREHADRVILVAHDGIKTRLKKYGCHDLPVFNRVIEEIGNAQLYANYLEVCHEMLIETVAVAGYEVEGFGGFYSLRNVDQTHFFAELLKQ